MADILCDDCALEKNRETANVACFQCRKFYCERCRYLHKSDEISKKHIIVALGQLVSEFENDDNFDYSSDFLGLILQDNKIKEHFEQVAVTTDCDSSFSRGNKEKDSKVLKHSEQVAITTSESNEVSLKEVFDTSKVETPANDKNAQVVINRENELESKRELSDRTLSKKLSKSSLSQKSSESNLSQKSSDTTCSSKELKDLEKRTISFDDSSSFPHTTEFETNCLNIRGVGCLSDGRVIAYNGHKRRLLLFDEQGKIICSAPAPHCWTFAITKTDEVALTCYERKSIIFFSAKETAFEKLSKTFNVNGECYGIACCGNRYAVTCDIRDENTSSLLILNSEGREMKKIKSVKGFKRPPFNECVAITSSYVYLSDFDDKRIVCLKHDGSLAKFISLSWRPTGLFIGSTHVMVGDYDNKQIKLLTRADYSVKLLKKDIVSSPTFLHYDERLGRILMCVEGCSTLYIYCIQNNEMPESCSTK